MLEKLLETLSVFILNTIESFGELGVFVLMALESANIPIPSEIVMPFSGFLVSRGAFGFWSIILIGTLGQLVGSLVSYYIAGHFRPWTERRMAHSMEFQIVDKWFKKYGVATAFWSRLLPVVRTFISFPAGMFRVNIWKFSALTFVGSFIWTWLLTYVGFMLGENWNIIEPYFRKFDFVIAGVILLGLGLWVWYHFKRK